MQFDCSSKSVLGLPIGTFIKQKPAAIMTIPPDKGGVTMVTARRGDSTNVLTKYFEIAQLTVLSLEFNMG